MSTKDRTYLDIPGSQKYLLPPLILSTIEMHSAEHLLRTARETVAEDEGQISLGPAIDLVQGYTEMIAHWQLGKNIMEWILRCQQSFGAKQELQELVSCRVWPRADNYSLVMLLKDKGLMIKSLGLEKAMGLRLTFSQPPPLDCFSNGSLAHWNNSAATAAYETWASMAPNPICLLPPERFSFHIKKTELLI